MFIIVSAKNLFLLYLGLELQALGFYILAGLKRYSNLSIEAALKYFIYSSVASAIYLFEFLSFTVITVQQILIKYRIYC